jgi:hypothetical protein
MKVRIALDFIPHGWAEDNNLLTTGEGNAPSGALAVTATSRTRRCVPWNL